jgi:replicative DNA helicase
MPHLYIDDSPGLSILELRTKARRLVREKGVQFIVIDYLQLMNASGMKFGSREQEVSMISRSLKQLAKELNIPIVALSQLNRSVESRSEDKRPQLSDLRESGAIEQDADIVCFIHRPEYYLHGAARDDKPELRGKAEFIIAKHRSGSVEDVDLRFRARFARFESWSEIDTQFTQDSAESAMNDYNDMPGAAPGSDPLGGAPTSPLQGGTANIASDDSAPF